MAVVVKECAYALVHVPNFVRYGSKPIRDIAMDGGPGGELEQKIMRHVRTFEDAVAYPPNQVFIGNMHPDQLNDVPQPWYGHLVKDARKDGPVRRDHGRKTSSTDGSRSRTISISSG